MKAAHVNIERQRMQEKYVESRRNNMYIDQLRLGKLALRQRYAVRLSVLHLGIYMKRLPFVRMLIDDFDGELDLKPFGAKYKHLLRKIIFTSKTKAANDIFNIDITLSEDDEHEANRQAANITLQFSDIPRSWRLGYEKDKDEERNDYFRGKEDQWYEALERVPVSVRTYVLEIDGGRARRREQEALQRKMEEERSRRAAQGEREDSAAGAGAVSGGDVGEAEKPRYFDEEKAIENKLTV